MGKRQNYDGAVFNHLTVVRDAEDRFSKGGQRIRRVWCKCDCGNPELICVDLQELKKGGIQGCKQCKPLRDSKLKKHPFNKYEIVDNVVYVYHDTIPNFYTIIDLKWLDYFKNWHLGCTPGIPSDSYWYIVQNQKKVKIHQIIKGKRCDHINGNKNDNREINLRKATQHQNNLNRPNNINNKTGYKGVTFCKNLKYKKYKARIEYNNNVYSLGFYLTPEEAAIAYDKKAIELFGEFAWTNFPKENYE